MFVHGLGGSLAQFNPLLTSLVNIAPCLGIDLPGCGLSDFAPTAWECYTPEALVELLGKVIEKHITSTERQGVVLIAHSMGCSLSALLACPESILRANQHINILGLVALCPRASPLSEQERAIYSRLLRLPTMLFDVWRRWDRRGGPESNSVARFVGKDADLGVKKLQERFNAQVRLWRFSSSSLFYHPQRRSLVLYDRLHPFAAQRLLIWYVYGTWMSVQQPSPSPLQSFRILTVRLKKSRTPVWRRMALGMLPSIHGPTVKSGLPGLSVWATLDIPLLLIGGRNDQVTKPEEVEKISGELEARTLIGSTKELTGRRKTVNRDIFRNGIQQGGMKPTETNDHGQTNEAAPRDSLGITFYSRNNQVVRTKILPAPASHALPYDPITYRTVAGNIQPFLADFVDSRLSIGWQLTYLSTEGKWDVKNLKKWRDVDPVSGPIAGIFRAMKTLRQIDDRHSPKEFIHDWGSKIYAVIDISHDSPVYDPKDFEEGSIGYYKLPSVSKIPPTTEETQEFIQLVDRLRTNRDAEHEFNALIGVQYVHSNILFSTPPCSYVLSSLLDCLHPYLSTIRHFAPWLT